MVSSNQGINPSKAHVVLAEDSMHMAESISVGLRWLVGIKDENYHYFEELDQAKNYLEKDHDRKLPTLVILDNNTPSSSLTGYSLTRELLEHKEEYPNLIVVTISSSDMGLLTKDSGKLIKDLKELGGEFWAKHTERHLMTLWLGDCLRAGTIVPREQWLGELGIDTRYQDTTEPKGKEEEKLFYFFDKIASAEKWKDKKPEMVLREAGLERGDVFRLGSREVLSALGFPKGSVEGNLPQMTK